MKFCWIYTHFADPFIYWRTLGLLQYFSYCEQSYYELGMQTPPHSCFLSFGFITRSVIVGTQVTLVVIFFHGGFIILCQERTGSQCLQSITHTCCFLTFLSFFLDSRHPNGREVVYLCSLDLHFPNDNWYWTSFHMLTDNLCNLFWRNV